MEKMVVVVVVVVELLFTRCAEIPSCGEAESLNVAAVGSEPVFVPQLVHLPPLSTIRCPLCGGVS